MDWNAFLKGLAIKYELSYELTETFLTRLDENNSQLQDIKIADQLCVSEIAFKKRMSRIYDKFSQECPELKNVEGRGKLEKLRACLWNQYQTNTFLASEESLPENLDLSTSFKNNKKIDLYLTLRNSYRNQDLEIKQKSSSFREEGENLVYEITEKEEELNISPKLKYLSNVENEDLITYPDHLIIDPYFKWEYPNLDLRVVNNTDKTVCINDIILEVKKSHLDPYPIIILARSVSDGPISMRKLSLVNNGWGEARNISLKFNLSPVSEEINFNENYKNEIFVESFSDFFDIDFSDALNEMGVDISRLNPYAFGPRCQEAFMLEKFLEKQANSDFMERFKSTEDVRMIYEKISQMVQSLGPFSDSVHMNYLRRQLEYIAIAYGEISFSGCDIDGVSKISKFPFLVHVPLLYVWGGGGVLESTFQYQGILDVERENYQVSVYGDGSSAAQYLKIGEADRFNVFLGAKKSSFHTFRLKLVCNDGQCIFSPIVNLRMLVPRIYNLEDICSL